MDYNRRTEALPSDRTISGEISKAELDGGIDLYLTLASGQSYRWRRADGDLFDRPTSWPTPWYETVADDVVIRVRETEEALEYRGTDGVETTLNRLLRLDDDLDRILSAGPDREIYRDAIQTCRGMRLVEDSLYVGLISFICSTNMRVERIHSMVQSLMERFGDRYELDGRPFFGFPEPAALAAASTEEIQRCGLGYRASYVKRTAEAIATNEISLPEPTLSYEDRRNALTAYHGVGPKVADCALLFGAGDLEAVPLDRWIKRAIETYFPACLGGNYDETSRAIRASLGPYPGYAQTYLFHHLRVGDVEV